MGNSKFKINYRPHAGQLEILNEISQCKADIITIVGSRGWGKDVFANNSIVLPLMCKFPNTQVMWVAPTYKICKAPIDDIWFGIDENSGQRFIPQFDENSGYKFWDRRKSEMELQLLFNRSVMHFRSADNPDSIVGKGYNLIIVNEAALLKKEVFMQQILPTARRKNCKIVLISTPRGKNWFHEMYLAGQDSSNPEYISFRQPWWKRPDYPAILKRLMKNMPEHLRKQEFEAEFIDSGGGAFKNLSNIFRGEVIQFPSSDQLWNISPTTAELTGESFVLAVDLAKSSDFTVLCVMGIESKRLFYYERFNKTDYQVVVEKIARVANSYDDADVIIDATGVGSGLVDFLATKLNVHPFIFTNESKNELINRLIIACEYNEISLPNIQTIREEFELFTYDVTKTGKLTYGAPDGKHDDIVIAVALANWYCVENSGKTQVEELDSFLSTVEEIRRPKSRLDLLLEEDD